jgi:hypothetical protein
MYRNSVSSPLPRAGLWLMLAALLAAAFALSSADPAHALPRLTQCENHMDDDGDGTIDFPASPGCASPSDTNETNPAIAPPCSDAMDNDIDGKVDFPIDPGCRSAGDSAEADPAAPRECSDGIDNDADTIADFGFDLGCIAASDNSELNRACSDGIDNDNDGAIDFPADWGCAAPTAATNQPDNSELDPPQCNDGIDNDGDGTLDADTNISGQTKDPGCTGPTDNSESPNPECSNGIDDDRDSKVDYPADPGCSSVDDTDEADPPPPPSAPAPTPQCSDTIDNDSDGKTDFPADAGCSSKLDTDETDPASVPKAGTFDTSGPKAPSPPANTGPKAVPPGVRPLISPFPVIRLRGRVDRNGAFITLLRVQAPKGSKVSVFCKGKSCPLRWKSVITTTGIVRSRPFERRLRVGTTLTIYVTKAGFTGKYTRFKIRKKKAPTRIDRCARSMGGPPVSCASN